jgi:uncharacterized protein YjiK
MPKPFSGNSVSPSSALHGLRLAATHKVDAAIREPSDLAYDPATRMLWTVSDEAGTVHRIRGDGASDGPPIRLNATDLEGVAIDPSSGVLFVLDEHRRQVTEVGRDGKVLRQFTVPVKENKTNAGLEGIAFDAARNELVLVNERPAELLFCDRAGRVTARARVDTQDLSAVAIGPGGRSLFVAGRFEEAIIEVDRAGRRLNRFAVNVPGVEGLAFDDAGRLIVIADNGPKAAGSLYVFSREGT